MRNAKVWLIALSILSAVLGTALLAVRGPAVQAAPVVVIEKDHWRNHDGHWCYWSEADKHWYYTDGVHWFIEDGGWKLYRFDRKFGHEGFVHGEYKVPSAKVEIVLPKHGVYRP
jgi:hypothetical protein